jgi:hypothetical protein
LHQQQPQQQQQQHVALDSNLHFLGRSTRAVCVHLLEIEEVLYDVRITKNHVLAT